MPISCPECDGHDYRAFDADGGVYVECVCGWSGLIPNPPGKTLRAVMSVTYDGLTAMYTADEYAAMQQLVVIDPVNAKAMHELKSRLRANICDVAGVAAQRSAVLERSATQWHSGETSSVAKTAESDGKRTDADPLVTLLRETSITTKPNLDEMTFL